jgi:hypothetical protein
MNIVAKLNGLRLGAASYGTGAQKQIEKDAANSLSPHLESLLPR